jgi:hypothetical protein
MDQVSSIFAAIDDYDAEETIGRIFEHSVCIACWSLSSWLSGMLSPKKKCPPALLLPFGIDRYDLSNSTFKIMSDAWKTNFASGLLVSKFIYGPDDGTINYSCVKEATTND